MKPLRRNLRTEKILLGLIFVLFGSLIIVVFSPYRPLMRGVYDTVGRLVLSGILLAAALFARKKAALERYWLVLFGLFILALAVSLDYWAAKILLSRIDVENSPRSFALEKVRTCLIVTIAVLSLTQLSGKSLGSIYVQRGKLKQSLLIGWIAFFVAAAGSIPMSGLLFTGEGIGFRDLWEWLPWILVFVFANAANEELLFRGLFLRKLEPFFGRFGSNCLIVLVFTALHLGVSYTQSQIIFLLVVIPLALAWGYLMQKTDTIWGSILFHAGTDIPIVLSLFSAL
jgi:membrane protease YdiL (CAAX protease family)